MAEAGVVNGARSGIGNLRAAATDEAEFLQGRRRLTNAAEERLLEGDIVRRAGDYPGANRVEAHPRTMLGFDRADLQRHLDQPALTENGELLRRREVGGDEGFPSVISVFRKVGTSVTIFGSGTVNVVVSGFAPAPIR